MKHLRVLLIDDSADDATQIVRALARAGYQVAFERVDTPDGLLGALLSQTWDVAVADFVMPRFNGTAALALLRQRELELPFIFVSDAVDEEAVVSAMRAGAHDYIVRRNLARLAPAVARELREVAALRERDPQLHRSRVLATEMRNGIDAGQFFLEYQPILNLKTDTVVGVETLLRWRHPERGRLEPADFIDVAEQTGLINALTTFVLHRAAQEWTTGHEGGAHIGVNLSPRNLHDPQLAERVRCALDAHGVSPSMLSLEITETQMVDDFEAAAANLKRLRDMGVRVVVDDFGRGHSSLTCLRRLPIDELKIDRAFVTLATSKDEAIVRSTVDLAHNLGLTAVAEGVETESVRSHLRSIGCDAAQGFLISRAMPAREAHAWVSGQVGHS